MPLVSNLHTCSPSSRQTGLQVSNLSKEEQKEQLPKQIWYADDAAAGGKLEKILHWWNQLCNAGPWYGYHPKPSKTWLIVKEEYEEKAKNMFPSDINITSIGHRYLGSYIGTEAGKKEFIDEQITEWEKDITSLSDIAQREPQLAYSAFVYGTSKRWTFVARTTPGISENLKHLDWLINETFVPAIVGKEYISDTMHDVFTLPAKQGGLGITNISDTSNLEYSNSLLMTEELTSQIFNQYRSMDLNKERVDAAKVEIKKRKAAFYNNKRAEIYNKMQANEKRQLDLASEKGASSWLTSLPLAEYGFIFNKQEFNDAILLRYNFKIKNVAPVCVCGEKNSVNHALICKVGGYVSMRHNQLRDTTAQLLRSHQICKDVETEPHLIPLNGEILPPGTTTTAAQLDVCARNLWTPLAKAFVDVRVFHPQAPTNSCKSIPAMYRSHEQEKKRKYNSRVINVERATFTPLVFSTSGGMGPEAATFYKRVADRISMKTQQRYSDVISFIRRRLRFDLLKTCLIALRGYRGVKRDNLKSPIEELDMDIRK